MAFQDIDNRHEHLGTEVVPELLLCEGLASREGGRGILDLRLVYVVGHSHLGAVLQYHACTVMEPSASLKNLGILVAFLSWRTSYNKAALLLVSAKLT